MRSLTRYAAMAAWLLVLSATAGCENGRTRPPAVAVRVLHAAPARSTVEFLREQRSETQLDYRQASGQLFFDADEYDFTVRAVNPGGGTATSLGTFSRQLVGDNQYFFTITEVGGALTPIVVEKPPFTGTSAEITAVHAAPSLGPVSIYIEPDGTVPTSATPVGTLAFGETIPSETRPAGTYRLSLTESGNPANVLMTSAVFTLQEGQSYAYALIDPAADSHSPYTVAFLTSTDTTLLFDESIQSSLTVLNAAADGAPRDVFVDDDFTTPVLAAAPYLARSGDIPIAFGSRKLSVTPAGNTGVVEAENTATYARSRFHIALIGGDPGDLALVSGLDDRRRITGQARISFMNAASLYGNLEYFLVPPGTDISSLTSTIVLGAPSMTGRTAFPPGDYELHVREVNGSVLAGPTPVTLAEGELYSVLATNGAVAGTVDFVFFEDFVD